MGFKYIIVHRISSPRDPWTCGLEKVAIYSQNGLWHCLPGNPFPQVLPANEAVWDWVPRVQLHHSESRVYLTSSFIYVRLCSFILFFSFSNSPPASSSFQRLILLLLLTLETRGKITLSFSLGFLYILWWNVGLHPSEEGCRIKKKKHQSWLLYFWSMSGDLHQWLQPAEIPALPGLRNQRAREEEVGARAG